MQGAINSVQEVQGHMHQEFALDPVSHATEFSMLYLHEELRPTLTWLHDSTRGTRIGEAAHPGPTTPLATQRSSIANGFDDPDFFANECESEDDLEDHWPQHEPLQPDEQDQDLHVLDIPDSPTLDLQDHGLAPPLPSGPSSQDLRAVAPNATALGPFYNLMDDYQLRSWEWAELKAGIPFNAASQKQPAAARARPTRNTDPPRFDAHKDFNSSSSFTGARLGFIFTTAAAGTGYYKDGVHKDNSNLQGLIRTTLVLADITPHTNRVAERPDAWHLSAQMPELNSDGSHRRARRQRRQNGTIVRHNKRYPGPCPPLGTMLPRLQKLPETTGIGHKPEDIAGLWLLDTANANSWSTAKTHILERTTAHIVSLQETKK